MPLVQGATRGVLRLDDGQCLHLDLTRQFVTEGPDWNGQRVAVRGTAVAAQGGVGLSASCAGPLLLYADRLSLKVDR